MTTDMTIKTRFLIISDTHGADFAPLEEPKQRADVAIHCGDLTDGSKLEEFQSAVRLLKTADAPLKLIIAGNHDFTMDVQAFETKLKEAGPFDQDLLAKEYGSPGAARRLFDDLKEEGFVFLDEGTYCFTLESGAQLKVFASSYTPSFGAWGFQYQPDIGRHFAIGNDTHVVITHGPPKGILDYTNGGERAGCSNLFEAVANAKPRVHCFGHIHEGWGARLVSWKDIYSGPPNHFSAIDHSNSTIIEKLANLKLTPFDTEENKEMKLKRLEDFKREKCCFTSHCTGDRHPLRQGRQTLFVNASITGDEGKQMPWLVDIELPKASCA